MEQMRRGGKKYFHFCKCLALTLAAVLLFGQASNLQAAKSVSQLEKEKKNLQKEIDSLDSQLVELLSDIDTLDAQISAKEQEIADTEDELESAKQAVAEQYEAMKLRIQYMYENDDQNLLTVMLESGSISDFLNRLEYVNSVYSYDRDLLDSLEATQTEIEEMKKGLEEDKKTLSSQKSTLASKQASLNQMISAKEGQMDDFDQQLKEAKELAARQKALEEEQRRQEEARRQEQENNSGSGQNGKPSNGGQTSGGNKNPGHSTNVSGSEVVAYANTFVGNPYKWGGNDPHTGADCSGFVTYVFRHFGIGNNWGARPTSSFFATVGKEVSYENVQPGDIIYYTGHVAIYAGGGRIVEAQSTKAGITNNRTLASVRDKNRFTIRRVL